MVVDPSNPIGVDEAGQMTRTLPEDHSSGSVVAAMLPPGAHYLKAFGTLGADSLGSAANREPRRAVLFYAIDDDAAAAAIERLISAAGFDPLKVGGVADAGRIEVPVRMLGTCFSTVPSVTYSACAIPAFERPFAISAGTSPSRGVRSSSGSLTSGGDELLHEGRVDDRCAFDDSLERFDELVHVGHATLQQ